MAKVKILTAAEAANLVEDGMTVSTNGFVACDLPEELTSALEKRFLETGSPKNLTYFYAAGQGNRDPSWGFEVQESSFQVAEINADVFWKGEQKVTLGKARVTGTLTVVDKERFTQSVCRGIGHGKAFGCGLLQVAPIVF